MSGIGSEGFMVQNRVRAQSSIISQQELTRFGDRLLFRVLAQAHQHISLYLDSALSLGVTYAQTDSYGMAHPSFFATGY